MECQAESVSINALVGSSVWMVVNTESGKGDRSRHPMRQVLVPADDRIGCRALLLQLVP